MKTILFTLIFLGTLSGCEKAVHPSLKPVDPVVLKILQDSLTTADFSDLDFDQYQIEKVSGSREQVFRIGSKEKEFLVGFPKKWSGGKLQMATQQHVKSLIVTY